MAEEIPPLACLHVALIKPFLYSRKILFPPSAAAGAAGMTRKERRRRRSENELGWWRWGGKEKKKKDALKAMNLFMDFSLKLSSKDLTLFFPACVCIYKSECVRMCVYTSCSIMSLACVRKCVSARPLWACVCVCVCVGVGVCTFLAD